MSSPVTSRPDGERIEFVYDPFGRRMEKRIGRAIRRGQTFVPRAVTRFVWDGDVLVHEITRKAEAAGDPVVEEKTYCFEDDGFAPVAHRDAGGWFHYVNDPIGTPERLVGDDGKVACELRREAWGRTETAPGGKTGTALRFPGQYEDAETGLCYNRFRYYDPETGGYISSDPIGLIGGINTYRYGSNPFAWLDPLGLEGQRVLFGQRRISPDFATIGSNAPEYIRGKKLDEVAAKLRSGKLHPDQIRVDAFRHSSGELVALNNRGLAAPSMAGLQPTNVQIREPDKKEKDRIKEPPLRHCGETFTIPGPAIPITRGKSNTSIIGVVRIPK
jgi:RHS repeat-associated protein